MSDSPALSLDQAAALLGRFRGRTIAVIGDVVLDEYLIGRATRLSREAPVPVLELIERRWSPGAAGNPAANVTALGGRAVLVGIVGRDGPGRQLCAELERAGVELGGLVECPDRSTATKTRILATHASAHPQQVARIDDLPPRHLESAVEEALVRQVEGVLPACDAVLVSNYRGGVVTPRVLEAIVAAAGRRGIPTCVDTQGDLMSFRGFTLVKSNQPDAEAALGRAFTTEDEFRAAGAQLARTLGARHVVVTRGGDGMSVVDAGGAHTHLAPSNRTEVWDVTGAGDTVIAVLALGLAADAELLAAAQLANAAAGLVVRRIGVATVSPAELLATLAPA